MRILVTGSSGFIGTTLLEESAGRDELHGVDRRPPLEQAEGVEYHLMDLCDSTGLSGLIHQISPQVVIHLAAQARVDPSLTDPVGTYRDNVLATINLVQAVIALGADFKKFVYASSETVYGPAVTYPTPETASPNPRSPYAASKAASEILVQGALDGRALILRSGMGFGPRSDPKTQVVAKFIQRALRNEPLQFPAGYVPGGHPTRDLNFVTNFVDGVLLGIDSDASGTFNIASGKEISVLDLGRSVVRKVGSGSVEFDPSWKYRLGEEGLRTWLDISKARENLGCHPRVDLEEGLERTIRWMRGRPFR